jgi:hypothetical protein
MACVFVRCVRAHAPHRGDVGVSARRHQARIAHAQALFRRTTASGRAGRPEAPPLRIPWPEES